MVCPVSSFQLAPRLCCLLKMILTIFIMLLIDGKPVTIDEYEDAIAEWCEHRDAPDYKWRY